MDVAAHKVTNVQPSRPRPHDKYFQNKRGGTARLWMDFQHVSHRDTITRPKCRRITIRGSRRTARPWRDVRRIEAARKSAFHAVGSQQWTCGKKSFARPLACTSVIVLYNTKFLIAEANRNLDGEATPCKR